MGVGGEWGWEVGGWVVNGVGGGWVVNGGGR